MMTRGDPVDDPFPSEPEFTGSEGDAFAEEAPIFEHSPGGKIASGKVVLDFPDGKPSMEELREAASQHFNLMAEKPAETWATGVPAVDAMLEGGLALGAVNEIVADAESRGAQSLFVKLLERVRLERGFAAVVDPADAFDPETVGEPLLENLLWVRPESTDAAMRCADVLLRDDNFPYIFLDLRLTDERSLRKVPAHQWYRFQRVAEEHRVMLIALTPRPMVPSARVRVRPHAAFSVRDFDEPRGILVKRLEGEVMRKRGSGVGGGTGQRAAGE